MGVRFRVLGPLRVWDGTSWSPVRAVASYVARLQRARLSAVEDHVERSDRPATPYLSHGVTTAERIVPAHLPTALPGFSGRTDQLRRLDKLLLGPSPAAVTAAITGAAGVGKTALAVHWAHTVADRFPDGQLFVNLRGFHATGAVTSAGEVIRSFLDALAVPAGRLPVSVEGQVGLYRSLMAGRKMLLLLDNARNPDQVRVLLPGAPGCLVLVTSRDQLTGLVATDGARPLTVGLLPEPEAWQLLERQLGGDRLAREPTAGAEIVRRCAGLPLALAIVAARAASRPDFGLATIARELHEGLDWSATGDDATDLRAVFFASYRVLSSEAQRLFRLLATTRPGLEITAPATARLAGLSTARVRRLLDELVQVNLLAEPTAGRHVLHRLLRTYMTEVPRPLSGG